VRDRLAVHGVAVEDDCGRSAAPTRYANGDLVHYAVDALDQFLAEATRHRLLIAAEEIEPVIAFPEGAATEIVIHGENGFLVDDEDEMAAAAGRLDQIDQACCRASVASRYDARVVAARYEAAYRAACAGDHGRGAVAFQRPAA